MEVSNSNSGALFLRKQIALCEVEEFWALALNSMCQIITAQMLFRGTVDSCQVHPRDIFRFAILNNASSVLVGHNHPSTSCLPSPADIHLSKNLKKAGELLQIPLVDHIIVTKKDHFSFADNGWNY